MRHVERTVIAVLTVVLMVVAGVMPAAAGQSAAQTPAPIVGELMKVDTEAKMLTVVPADGPAVEIMYTDKTEVSGAKDTIAGLAAAGKQQVAVTFTEDAKTKAKTATRVEVRAAK